MVPTLRCGLVLSNFFFATVSSYELPLTTRKSTSRRSAAAHSLRQVSRHLCVVTELHRIRRAPRGHRPKLGSVAEHLGQGHVRSHVLRCAAPFHAEDMTTPRREVAHHVAEVFLGH